MAIAEQERMGLLGVKLSREQQEKLEMAASATGRSLEEFAASAIIHAADAVLESPPVTVLSDRDFEHFLSLRDVDTPPAPALAHAAEEYKRRLTDGSLQVED